MTFYNICYIYIYIISYYILLLLLLALPQIQTVPVCLRLSLDWAFFWQKHLSKCSKKKRSECFGLITFVPIPLFGYFPHLSLPIVTSHHVSKCTSIPNLTLNAYVRNTTAYSLHLNYTIGEIISKSSLRIYLL